MEGVSRDDLAALVRGDDWWSWAARLALAPADDEATLVAMLGSDEPRISCAAATRLFGLYERDGLVDALPSDNGLTYDLLEAVESEVDVTGEPRVQLARRRDLARVAVAGAPPVVVVAGSGWRACPGPRP